MELNNNINHAAHLQPTVFEVVKFEVGVEVGVEVDRFDNNPIRRSSRSNHPLNMLSCRQFILVSFNFWSYG